MGIKLGRGGRSRDWTKVSIAGAEAVVQAIALGPAGFGNSISAFFRAVEGLRGEDELEARATNLVAETLAYALADVLSNTSFSRAPTHRQAQELIKSSLTRAVVLATQSDLLLETENLKYPATLSVFEDAAHRLAHAVRPFESQEPESGLEIRFQSAVAEGLNRILARRPEYFEPVLNVLASPAAGAEARVRAWAHYRSALICRFEDAALFGEDERTGVTLGQVYQPLRAWWHDDVDDLTRVDSESPNGPTSPAETVYLEMLEGALLTWLGKDLPQDRVRLISGGPGSGKSTFARWLAAKVTVIPRWRVLFVPLQRLRGSGPLERIVDDYFRLHPDEPFGPETPPMSSIGRDGHQDWLIIFDGLDELAKEGGSSESAAQVFASGLADMRARLSGVARVRYVVLGRAPSMQEARRRLGLQGNRTLHVGDMAALVFNPAGPAKEVTVVDPDQLAPQDQRQEFWARWATAKGLPTATPEAMKAEVLHDLTKEPLLAFLLIKSGYVSERWREAAENRNRIYEAIFDKIWERERAKETRTNLNDIRKDGFDALMQALGLAAWRGGGRTGDEATFTAIRDAFVRPDILSRAKASGVADLNNIAVLFYTQKDEIGGRGYEFLHKSFGEYLTACGLHSAFRRWGQQVGMPEIDFDELAFLRRWLVLAGPASITHDIAMFLVNEVKLRALDQQEAPWVAGRKWTRMLETIVGRMLTDGIPAHEGAKRWREAETNARNAERTLILLLIACSEVAYPMDLLNRDADGGWTPGPVKIVNFQDDVEEFNELLRRLRLDDSGFPRPFLMARDMPLRRLSRLNLQECVISSGNSMLDFQGANLEGAYLFLERGSRCNFSGACLRRAHLAHSSFRHSDFRNADLREANLSGGNFDGANLEGAVIDGANMLGTNLEYADLRNASFVGARLEQANFSMADITSANFAGASLDKGALENALPEGESLRDAREQRYQRPVSVE